MLDIRVLKDGQEVRNIEIEGNNFLLVQNGAHGPLYDTENFKWLRIRIHTKDAAALDR